MVNGTFAVCCLAGTGRDDRAADRRALQVRSLGIGKATYHIGNGAGFFSPDRGIDALNVTPPP